MSEQIKHLEHKPAISSLKDFKAPTFKENERVLYFHPYNFYAQKVCF